MIEALEQAAAWERIKHDPWPKAGPLRADALFLIETGARSLGDRSLPWAQTRPSALDKGKITINCQGTGRGTHTDCHGWVNPGCEITWCNCWCHVDGSNPRWDCNREIERVWGPLR
jgi:hypothetical protein